MQSRTYAILGFGNEWKVVSGRGRIGTFARIEDAIVVGSRLAGQAREFGYAVELLVQDDVGQLRPHDVEDFHEGY